ncbi:MAG TPA: MBL fold metallo-hydrolase, partial [Candidatus Hodarchaeales archaeon]|nr:MBL fold metallo-hydrolase [Candidatus Hodarchaeales archaeon]
NWAPHYQYLDAVFVTHAHLDHSGAIPLVMSSRKLPWFSTKETKLLCSMLWKDMNRITRGNPGLEKHPSFSLLSAVTRSENIENALDNFYPLAPKESIQVLPNVEVTAHSAAHIFGSVGYEISIDGRRILYTGDFNSEGVGPFAGSQFPNDIDAVMFDGTYYGRTEERKSPQDQLKEILKESKRLLIPAFSAGRAQDVLYYLYRAGVFSSSGQGLRVIMTGMGGKIAETMRMGKAVKAGDRNLRFPSGINPDEFVEGTIVIAGQGMLQAGLSRTLLDETASDPDTGVVLCGYQAPQTLGWHLSQKHPYLTRKYQQRIHKISISGHTTGHALDQWMSEISGKKIMVHAPETHDGQLKRDDIIIPPNSGYFEIS